jgi:threonine dehydrogenase-like Zn-dependent dehydrogenase
LVINEVTVVGSRCGRFSPALNLLRQGLIPVRDLITGIYPFDEALTAFDHAVKPDAMKVLLQFNH